MEDCRTPPVIRYDRLELKVFWDINVYGAGPIIRISPTEVHISDPGYASVHFSMSVKRNRYAQHQKAFGTSQATINTIGHDHHRIRRSAMNRMFSKKQIVSLESLIREKVDKCGDRFEEFKHSQKVLNLRLLFTCLTTDIITQYTLARSYDLLSSPDLSPAWRDTFQTGLRKYHYFKHFPALWKVVDMIPISIITYFSPDFQMVLDFKTRISKQAAQIMSEDQSEGEKRAQCSTIFHQLLESELPIAEKTHVRLSHEAQSLIGAGTETTANVLCTIFFHLLAHPDKCKRLQDELRDSITDDGEIAWSLKKLEGLPYLTCVIREGLRLALGVTARIIRVTPDRTDTYDHFQLPPGTPVSMSTIPIHMNPHIFPDPATFEPERWLDGKSASDDLLVFSKGPRSCIGIK